LEYITHRSDFKKKREEFSGSGGVTGGGTAGGKSVPCSSKFYDPRAANSVESLVHHPRTLQKSR